MTAALARPAVDAMSVRCPKPVMGVAKEGKRRDERETPGSKALLPAIPP